MPAPAIDFVKRITAIPAHLATPPPESGLPRPHYERTANDVWSTVVYFDRNLRRVNIYRAPSERQLGRLNTMVLLSLVEAFERFFKEIAAACVDHVAGYVLDDRLDVFQVKGNALAAHFDADTLGRALCEQINKRFKRILADPFVEGKFQVFKPKTDRSTLVEIIWQLRHTIVHNAATVTRSDALKLRLLTRRPVDAPRVLWPTRGDVWYVKLYLDKVVEEINQEIGARLSELMTTLLADDPSLFAAPDKAQQLANLFGLPCSVGGILRHPL
jgi:hypothetical protein